MNLSKISLSIVTSVALPLIFSACGDSSSSSVDDSELTNLSSEAETLSSSGANGSSASEQSGTPENQESSSGTQSPDVSSSGSAPLSSGAADSTVSSSSAEPESSSEGLVAPAGEFTDSRDGKTYKLAKIGTQTWMAENLRYGDSSLYVYDNAQTVCPEGFHLPTTEQLKMLVEFVGGEEVAAQKLKSTTGWPNDEYGNWNGTDDYGFNAKPVESGFGTGTDENFWSSTRHFGDIWTGEFLKLDPHPTSKADQNDPSTASYSGPFYCDRDHMPPTYSPTLACFIHADPQTKLSVRCLSNIEDCGGKTIDNTKQFCQSGNAYDICRGRIYDARTYECKNDTLYERATGSLYKFSWVWLNSEKEYGLFLDKRDNQYYKTIKIDGVVWFAENLNYASEGSLCYMEDQYYCDRYGRMYTQKMVLNGADSIPSDEKVQGICPEGTHVATLTEMRTLRGEGSFSALYTAYSENDYDLVYQYDENATGFSLAIAGTYYKGESRPWSDLNREGEWIGSDFTYRYSHGWFSESSATSNYRGRPNETAFGSVRCIVD